MGRIGARTLGSFARLSAAIQRRLADFLELEPVDGSKGAAAFERRIDELRTRLGAALAERRRIERERCETDAATLRGKADRAIAIGRDDLARAALQATLALEERAARTEAAIRLLDAEADDLERAILAIGGGSPTLAAKLRRLDALIAAADQPPRET
jgi:phage shock protein A